MLQKDTGGGRHIWRSVCLVGLVLCFATGCDLLPDSQEDCQQPGFSSLQLGTYGMQRLRGLSLLSLPSSDLNCAPLRNGEALYSKDAPPSYTHEIVLQSEEDTLRFFLNAVSEGFSAEYEAMYSATSVTYSKGSGGTLLLQNVTDSTVEGTFSLLLFRNSLGCFSCDSLAIQGGFHAALKDTGLTP